MTKLGQICAMALASMSTPAFGVVPVDAIPLSRETVESDWISTRSKAKTKCKTIISKRLASIEAKLHAGNYSEAIDGDVQYACREVVVNVQVEKDIWRVVDAGHGWTNFKRTVYFEVYCAPRTLSDKQVFSQARSCEQQPLPECYFEAFLKRIEKINSTKFTYFGAKSC